MDILQLTASNVPITKGVEYSCVLTNNWSGANHPIDYASVSGSAHWSPPVLLAHSNLIDLWSPGDFASPGIESLAEMGTTSTLQSEIEVLQTKGLAGDLVIGVNQFNQFNAMNPTQDFETISLSPSFPCLSTISMMAPSPDWFSGIESFCPREPGGFWFQSFEVATYPFDAGTEMGETYSINNDPESRHGPIYPLTKDTVPDSGILLDPTGTKVNPVAVWKCDLNNFEEMDKSPEEMKKKYPIVKEDGAMKEIGTKDLKNMDKSPEEEFGVVKEDGMTKEIGMMKKMKKKYPIVKEDGAMKEIGMNDLKNMDKSPEEEFGVVKEDGMKKEIGMMKKMKKEDPIVKEDGATKEIGTKDLKNMDKSPEEEFGVVKEDGMTKEIGMMKKMKKENHIVKEDGAMKEIGTKDLKNMEKSPEEEFGVVKEDGMTKEIGMMKKEDPNGGRRALRGYGN